VNSIFSLRALAAQILPRKHPLEYGNAAEIAAIPAGRSEIS